MKRKRYSDQQIIQILKEAEAGVAVAELSRQHGFSQSAFYKWKAKSINGKQNMAGWMSRSYIS